MKPVSPIVPGVELPETVYAKDQPEYQALPSWKDEDGTVLTRWHLTWRERLKVLIKGDVYLWMLTFHKPLQPVMLQVERPEVPGNSPRIFKLGSFRLYRLERCRWLPSIAVSKRSEFFSGGIYGHWLKWSFEYDHVSKA